jgi:hypothetical protein
MSDGFLLAGISGWRKDSGGGRIQHPAALDNYFLPEAAMFLGLRNKSPNCHKP